MAAKQTQEPMPLARSRRQGLALEPTILVGGRVETHAQAEILLKTRTDLTRERAYAAKAQVGLAVMQQVGRAVEQNYPQFAEAEQELLSQAAETVKGQMADFFAQVRVEHANSLLDLQHIVGEKVKEVVLDPVEPAVSGGETAVEEKLPPFGGLFGGTKITRVKR